MDRVHAPSGQVVAAGAPRPVVQAITKEHVSLIDSVQDKLDAAYYERENDRGSKVSQRAGSVGKPRRLSRDRLGQILI